MKKILVVLAILAITCIFFMCSCSKQKIERCLQCKSVQIIETHWNGYLGNQGVTRDKKYTEDNNKICGTGLSSEDYSNSHSTRTTVNKSPNTIRIDSVECN